MKRVLLTTAAALILIGSSSAITISTDRLLGKATDNPANISDQFDALNTLIDMYNGGASVANHMLATPVGSLVPAPSLPALDSSVVGNASVPGDNTLIDITVPDSVDWVSLKSSTTTAFFYISDLAPGSHELENDGVILNPPGNASTGISNYHFFSSSTSSVPDSGTTLALLGAALLGIIGFRSRKN